MTAVLFTTYCVVAYLLFLAGWSPHHIITVDADSVGEWLYELIILLVAAPGLLIKLKGYFTPQGPAQTREIRV